MFYVTFVTMPLAKFLLFASIFFTAFACKAQPHLLQGKVTNTLLEPLSYVTVQLKNQQIGTKTNDKGNYKFMLEEGEYDLVFTFIGHETKVQKVIVKKGGTTLNVILQPNAKSMNEVKITANKKDRAEEIIKQVIQHKEENRKQANTYTCNVYIKATENNVTKTKKEKTVPIVLDSLIKKHIRDSIQNEMNSMSMAEILLQLDYEFPNKIKEERTGIKKRGNTANLFYLSTTEGNFSLYNNLLQVPALCSTPFLSPISYSGLVAYKFKTVKVEKKSSYNLYTIRFSPIKVGNALLEGEVIIVDSTWVITDASFSFPNHLLAEYDKFEVTQSYETIQQRAVLLDRLELNYFSKQGKTKSNGNTIVIFNNYQLDTTFSKKHFNTEVSSTSLEAYERDTNFWNTVRKEPLTEKEMGFIKYKDSVYDYTHTTKYLDSIDKRENKIKWHEIVFTGVSFYKRANERHIGFYPLMAMYRPLLPGGARIAMGGNYSIIPKNRHTFSVSGEVAYNYNQKNIIGFLRGFYRYNAFNNGYVSVSTGKSYDLIFANDSYINILRRSNFYLKKYLDIEHGVEILNGLVLRNKVEFSTRLPVSINKNTNDTLIDNWLSNAGANNSNYGSFTAYNALYNIVTLEYTPKQMYMREPRQKVILGSKYPTLYAKLRTGMPEIFNSVVNYNYAEIGVKQRLKIGLLGISDYKIFAGNFITKKNLQTIDYKFIRRGDPFFFFEPTTNFQQLDSTFPVFKTFVEGHYLHEFYGSLINKIPYMKKLKLYEVAGSGLLFLPERKLLYAELFAGIEKPFKAFGEKFKVGIYAVGSVANKQNKPFQFKIGIQHYDTERNRWE